MPYLGKQPANVPVTADDIPDNSITAAKIVDGGITAADIGANAVGLSELSATGTASTSTFLRGDNAWVAVDTNLVSDTSPQLGGNLDLNSNSITGSGGIPAANLTGTIAADRLSTATTQSASNNSTKIATTAYTDAQVATVVDSAPGTLNTLNELAAALGDDANFSTTVTNSIAAKLPLAGGTMTGTISAASDLVFDAGSDIVLDADGGKIKFRDNGDDIGYLQNTSGDFIIKAITDDKDIKIQGKDGGAFISAVTFDMSEAGYATFNNWLKVNDRVVGNSNLVLNTSDGNEKIHLDASGYIKLETAGAERMRINSSGNVGIGVVPEVWNTVYDGLQIGNTGSLAGYSGSGIDRVWLTANGYVDNNDGSWQYINTDTASQYEQRDGKHNFFVASSGSADATISWANAMTIGNDGRVAISQTGNATAMQVSTSVAAETTAIFQGGGTGAVDVVDVRDSNGTSKFKVRQNGKVGIGETAPLGQLHIKENDSGVSSISANGDQLVLENSGHCGMHILSGTGSDGVLYFGDSGGSGTGQLKYQHASNQFAFETAQSGALIIDADGRLLLGTTANNNVNNNGISVNAGAYGNWAMKVAHSAGTGDGYGIMINIPNYTGSGGQHMINFYTAGGAVGSIKSNQSSTAYNTSSDYRLKENVDYDWDATTRLKQLKPARFNWISDDTNTLVDGFIAHEVSSVVPEAISGVKDATKNLTNVVLKANGKWVGDGITKEDWEQGKSDGEYPSDSTWKASHTENVYQEIDQSKLVPLLVKTIQELEARITALEA